MNWFKPMVLMVVLGAILYGVYVVLNKGPAPTPPPGVSQDWAKEPQIVSGVPDNGLPSKRGLPPGPPDDPRSIPSAPPWAAGQPPAAPPISQNPSPAPIGNQVDNSHPNGGLAAPSPAPHDLTPPPIAPPSSPTNPSPITAIPPGRPDDGIAPRESFSMVVERIRPMLSDGRLVEALRILTKWHDNPQLTPDESRELSLLLSQLAGTVVYSRQHLLEPAYEVKTGDRLETIAQQYNIPWQLLAKINGIGDPNRLVPGEKLKVLRGPFTAEVSLDRRQMTLLVEDCYAGRFPLVGVGDAAKSLDGSFEVGQKTDPMAGAPPGSYSSGPARRWVGFGDNMGIVDSAHPRGLSLNTRDAEDVYDILSVGSRIVVRR